MDISQTTHYRHERPSPTIHFFLRLAANGYQTRKEAALLGTQSDIQDFRILVVDDDEDVHAITKIALRPLRYKERGVQILEARSSAEALEVMRCTPAVAVILLDVVMESSEAGLHACRAIREHLENRFVRIILRTGQPGMAPEERVVQDYDIDGYLPKGEVTSTRLVTMVRTALKSYDEITDLESKRRSLESVHESVHDLSETSTWSALQREPSLWEGK
ncbi:response regulator [Streptomyces sp. CA-251387]|uniref:response regulator n=1 Tax=Streptomyces sp. CA-251387 TaxID=3240064 RepID=UPI003D94EF02